MKHVMLSLFLGLSAFAHAQNELPPVPAAEAVNLRLELASVEMDRASELREVAVWVACASALFIASDRINNRDSDGSFAAGVATFGVAGYVGLNALAIRHDKRAARLLHGQ
jgi:hypothetical protein